MFLETFVAIRDPSAKTRKFVQSSEIVILMRFVGNFGGGGRIRIDIFPQKTFPLIRGVERGSSEFNTNDAPLCGVLNNTQLSGEIACER